MVHFSGRLKPWLYRSGHPFDQLFFDVLDRTDWAGFRPPRTLRSVAMSLYDSPVRRLFHPLEIRLLKRLRDWQKAVSATGFPVRRAAEQKQST